MEKWLGERTSLGGHRNCVRAKKKSGGPQLCTTIALSLSVKDLRRKEVDQGNAGDNDGAGPTIRSEKVQ